MLKLLKNDALSRAQLANKARKKIPLYEQKNSWIVKVPFLEVKSNKTRYLEFAKLTTEDVAQWKWAFTGIVD